MTGNRAYERLMAAGIKPSQQRIEIMDYLMTHYTHPTVDDVYNALSPKMPTLSLTTVYNTLRTFSEKKVAQMLTIDDHHVCYDGDTSPHVHFFCRSCGKVLDMPETAAPKLDEDRMMDGFMVDEVQLYYRGICADCLKKDGEVMRQA